MDIEKYLSLAILIGALSCGPVAANSPFDTGPTPEQVLANMGLDTSELSLTALATDTSIDLEIRYLAIVSLGRTKDPVHLTTLETLLNDNASEARIASLIALRTMAEESAQARIGQVVEDDSDTTVRRVAITALAVIGSERSLEPLLKTVENVSGPSELRTEALSAVRRMINLRNIQYSNVSERLKLFLTDREKNVRLAVALTAVEAGDNDGIAVLVDIATQTDSDEWTIEKAVRSIQEHSSRDFGYFSNGDQRSNQAEKNRAIRDIRAWWEENKNSYQSGASQTGQSDSVQIGGKHTAHC